MTATFTVPEGSKLADPDEVPEDFVASHTDLTKLVDDITRVDIVNGILNDVVAEMQRQVEKWGEQRHPDGTGSWDFKLKAETAKKLNDLSVEAGTLTWVGILLEEVWEAFEEKYDNPNLDTELIQVMAVVASWLLDRRKNGR